MKTRITAALAFALVAGGAHAQTAQPVLDLATAKAIAEGCEKYAAGKGWRMITAVHDTAGNPKYFSRMDGSILISVQVAQLKADTSLPSRRPPAWAARTSCSRPARSRSRRTARSGSASATRSCS